MFLRRMGDVNRKLITETKIYTTVKSYVKKGKKLFIIYPYGNRGKMAEQVLSESFMLHDYILADNYCKEDNILRVDQLNDFADDYVLLLCSDNPNIYQDIRKGLKVKFQGEICDLAEIDLKGTVYDHFILIAIKC